MSNDLLATFATSMVDRLVADGLLEVAPGRTRAVAAFVAEQLAQARHASLVSEVARALVAAPDVLELYADNEQIKEIVDGLDRRAAGL